MSPSPGRDSEQPSTSEGTAPDKVATPTTPAKRASAAKASPFTAPNLISRLSSSVAISRPEAKTDLPSQRISRSASSSQILGLASGSSNSAQIDHSLPPLVLTPNVKKDPVSPVEDITDTADATLADNVISHATSGSDDEDLEEVDEGRTDKLSASVHALSLLQRMNSDRLLSDSSERSQPTSPKTPSRPRTEKTGSSTFLNGQDGDEGTPPQAPARLFPPRRYYVLSSAGKPVYISHLAESLLSVRRSSHTSGMSDEEIRSSIQAAEDSAEEAATTQVGVMAALISIYADEDGDKLRHITTDDGHQIVFYLRAPLYLIAWSQWGEPVSVLKTHLEYLHLQILSIVSAGQLSKVFGRSAGFDLRRLIEGTEEVLGGLLERLQTNLGYVLGALQPLRLPRSLRDAIANTLLPSKTSQRPKDLLYVLLLYGEKIVTLLRPRKHSVHPADMHLLVNLVCSKEALREAGSEAWLPICLPKFAPQGFVYAYISSLGNGTDLNASGMLTSEADEGGDAGPALVIVSGSKEAFPELSSWRHEIHAELVRSGALAQLVKTGQTLSGVASPTIARTDAYPLKATESSPGHAASPISFLHYSADELGIPGLRHFLYKSRTNTQLTSPSYESPYLPNSEALRRLATLYSMAHDAIHATGRSPPPTTATSSSTIPFTTATFSDSSSPGSQQDTIGSARVTASGTRAPIPPTAGPAKMYYLRTEQEAILGWITKPFELYLTVSPWLGKKDVVKAANEVTRWVKKLEYDLFLLEAPVW